MDHQGSPGIWASNSLSYNSIRPPRNVPAPALSTIRFPRWWSDSYMSSLMSTHSSLHSHIASLQNLHVLRPTVLCDRAHAISMAQVLFPSPTLDIISSQSLRTYLRSGAPLPRARFQASPVPTLCSHLSQHNTLLLLVSFLDCDLLERESVFGLLSLYPWA